MQLGLNQFLYWSDGMHRYKGNLLFSFFFLSRRRHTRCGRDWSSDVCSSDLPAALGEGLRTTAAHSTLVLADSNSTAIHPDGSLGRGVVEVELARTESENGSRIEASHDGYVDRKSGVEGKGLDLGGQCTSS